MSDPTADIQCIPSDDIIHEVPEDDDADESPIGVWRTLLKKDIGRSSADDARRRVLSMAAARNKSTYRKVEEAVAVIGTSDTGASIPAILTWIINNYPTLDQNKLKVNVKRAVLKGLKNGLLVRTRNSKKAVGVAGSFTFPAQRIKLKAVRLEGRKYVFPILQPVSSSSSTSADQDKGGKPEVEIKSSPKRVNSTPKRARLNASKLVHDSAEQVKGNVKEMSTSSPKISNLTPKRANLTPKSVKKNNPTKLVQDGEASTEPINGTTVEMTTLKRANLTPKRASKMNPSELVHDGEASAEQVNGTEMTSSSPKISNLTPKRANLTPKRANKLNPSKLVTDDNVSADQIKDVEKEGSSPKRVNFTPKRSNKMTTSKLVPDGQASADQVKEIAADEENMVKSFTPKRAKLNEEVVIVVDGEASHSNDTDQVKEMAEEERNVSSPKRVKLSLPELVLEEDLELNA